MIINIPHVIQENCIALQSNNNDNSSTTLELMKKTFLSSTTFIRLHKLPKIGCVYGYPWEPTMFTYLCTYLSLDNTVKFKGSECDQASFSIFFRERKVFLSNLIYKSTHLSKKVHIEVDNIPHRKSRSPWVDRLLFIWMLSLL